MILSVQIERLSPHLEELPALTNEYQRGEPAFPEHVLKWLSEVEKTMTAVRLREGSELPVLRGRILKTVDMFNADSEKTARSRVRSARNLAAVDALERAEAILRGCIGANQERLERFEEKLCEGMTALALQVRIPPRHDGTAQWLMSVWRLLRDNDATRGLAIYLSASLNAVDRLFILESVLRRLTSEVSGS